MTSPGAVRAQPHLSSHQPRAVSRLPADPADRAMVSELSALGSDSRPSWLFPSGLSIVSCLTGACSASGHRASLCVCGCEIGGHGDTVF